MMLIEIEFLVKISVSLIKYGCPQLHIKKKKIDYSNSIDFKCVINYQKEIYKSWHIGLKWVNVITDQCGACYDLLIGSIIH